MEDKAEKKKDNHTIDFTFDITVDGLKIPIEDVQKNLADWTAQPFGARLLLIPEITFDYKGSIVGFAMQSIEKYSEIFSFLNAKDCKFKIRIGVFVDPRNVMAFSIDLNDKQIDVLKEKKGGIEFNVFMCDDDHEEFEPTIECSEIAGDI